MPKAVLFDLDCTLTDRARSIERFAPIFMEHFGRRLHQADPDQFLASFLEIDDLGYAKRSVCSDHLLATLGWNDPPSHRELDRHWKEHSPRCAVAAAQSHEVLRILSDRGYVLGIITNGPVSNQERKIEAIGVRPWMKEVLISEAVGYAKPTAEIFHLACRRVGVRPDEAWYVGDHPHNDVHGARAAGLTEVWMRVGRKWSFGGDAPARQLDNLIDLLALLP